MGLLSLFSSRKGTDPAPERGRRTRVESSSAGIGASRRAAEEYSDKFADDSLDPDFPQKQRARRRLIGAVVLLAAAIIVLPIVFEHKPRPVSEDVAVSVANGQGAAQKPKVEARKAEPLPPAANANRNDAALDAGEEIVNTPATDKSDKSDKPKVDAKAEAKVADSKPADKADNKADKPVASTKYLILIGAFASEERAKNWLAKLKESKVPAYVEKKMLADGERNLLRAGPFPSRDAADAADKKIRAIGLTSKIVEQ